MTDEEALALGRRLVACKGFRPMRGMKDCQGKTWTPDLLFRWHETDTPDVRDPATRGCVLELVREAWPEPDSIILVRGPDEWAHLLVAALEAAPCST